jgi:hypothetical protein
LDYLIPRWEGDSGCAFPLITVCSSPPPVGGRGTQISLGRSVGPTWLEAGEVVATGGAVGAASRSIGGSSSWSLLPRMPELFLLAVRVGVGGGMVASGTEAGVGTGKIE